MKAVILAGGFGTRLSEETTIKPKPMVEIGEMPILWHIMKSYSAFGINEFIICLGYKGYFIKEFFSKYYLHQSSVTFDIKNNTMEVHRNNTEPWKVALIDTGQDTMTGGRIKKIQEYVGEETFCMTYGDGVSDINISELIAFHKKKEVYATLTAVQPPGRFGAFNLHHNNDKIESFKEKPRGDSAWINGGFFVLEPEIFKYIKDDSTVWEREPMESLAVEGKLAAYRHTGFWQPMDTLRDKNSLEQMWESGNAPWKVWQ
jgi:glucose-1-phosphate cytidylyltransferase